MRGFASKEGDGTKEWGGGGHFQLGVMVVRRGQTKIGRFL